jgi:hypothetical protein
MMAQDQSVLCSLPAEIRNNIFALALTAEDDVSQPYRDDSKYYRPGYRYRRKVDLSLLRTCRQIYREARLLPISMNEHLFWLFNGPIKGTSITDRNTARWDVWYDSLTQDQQLAVQRVHIFTQQYFLENLVAISGGGLPHRTACLHLTFRHSDWWSWESPPASSDKLGICPWRQRRTSYREMMAEPAEPDLAYIQDRMVPGTWGAAICEVQDLSKLVVEFETDEKKQSQLEAVVERAKGWKFSKPGSHHALEWDGRLVSSSWEGLRDLRSENPFNLVHVPVPTKDLPTRTYQVVKMTWNKKPLKTVPEM